MDKSRRNQIIVKTLLILCMLVITFFVLFPLYFVISTSLKSYSEYIRDPIGFDVSKLSLANYKDVLTSSNMGRAFLNSIFITAISVICTVIFAAIGSFAITIINFSGSKIFAFLAIVTMFFTGELTYIPLYLVYSSLGLTNTYWVLIIPCFICFPSLGLVLGSNYLGGVPRDIAEAAALDGAGFFTMFRRLYLPLMRPVIALVAVMSFQSAWSEFFWPMITTLGNQDVQTLPLLILGFSSADSSLFGQYCAGLALMTLPMIVVYIFLSKYFIQGMTAGSVKL